MTYRLKVRLEPVSREVLAERRCRFRCRCDKTTYDQVLTAISARPDGIIKTDLARRFPKLSDEKLAHITATLALIGEIEVFVAYNHPRSKIGVPLMLYRERPNVSRAGVRDGV